MKPKTDSVQATSNSNNKADHGSGMTASSDNTKILLAVVATAVIVALLAVVLNRHAVQTDHCPAPAMSSPSAEASQDGSYPLDPKEDDGECVGEHDPSECSWECCAGRRNSKIFTELNRPLWVNLFAEEEYFLEESYKAVPSLYKLDNDRCCMTDYKTIPLHGPMKDSDGEWCYVVKLGERKQHAIIGNCSASNNQGLCERDGQGRCTQQTTLVPLLCLSGRGSLVYRKFIVNLTCSCQYFEP